MRNRSMVDPRDNWSHVCTSCGKRCFETKRDAKKARKVIDRTMAVYEHLGWWHVGHLPKVVTSGRFGRGDVYRTTSKEN